MEQNSQRASTGTVRAVFRGIVRRRKLGKGAVKVANNEPPSEANVARKETWKRRLEAIFRGVESRAPRAGTVVLESGEKLFSEIGTLAPI